jgi:putative transposase
MLCANQASGLSFSCGLVHDSQGRTVTDGERQRLPLCRGYQVVLFDVQPVQVWGDGVLANRAIFWALGLAGGGQWDVLGVWPSLAAGSAGWSEVFWDLKTRGVERVSVFTFPERKDVREAATAAFPQATLLPSIAWLRRTSLMQVPSRHRLAVAEALDGICNARSLADARDSFANDPLSAHCSASVDLRRGALEQLAPYYALPRHLQRCIRSGEGVVQGLHESVGRAVTKHGVFADPDAAMSLVLGALQRAGRRVVGEVAPPRLRSVGRSIQRLPADVAAVVS